MAALESLHVLHLGSSTVGSSLPNSVAGPMGIQRTAPLPRPTEEIQLYQWKAVRDERQTRSAGVSALPVSMFSGVTQMTVVILSRGPL